MSRHLNCQVGQDCQVGPVSHPWRNWLSDDGVRAARLPALGTHPSTKGGCRVRAAAAMLASIPTGARPGWS